jgi:hypothetical protein
LVSLSGMLAPCPVPSEKIRTLFGMAPPSARSNDANLQHWVERKNH